MCRLYVTTIETTSSCNFATANKTLISIGNCYYCYLCFPIRSRMVNNIIIIKSTIAYTWTQLLDQRWPTFKNLIDFWVFLCFRSICQVSYYAELLFKQFLYCNVIYFKNKIIYIYIYIYIYIDAVLWQHDLEEIMSADKKYICIYNILKIFKLFVCPKNLFTCHGFTIPALEINLWQTN
jgi:hypothetical protein